MNMTRRTIRSAGSAIGLATTPVWQKRMRASTWSRIRAVLAAMPGSATFARMVSLSASRSAASKNWRHSSASVAFRKNLSSCHTATIDDYTIEGHVPAADIRRLLAERPEWLDLPFQVCRSAHPAWVRRPSARPMRFFSSDSTAAARSSPAIRAPDFASG